MTDHAKALADALERLLRNFPTDTDMVEAGWTGSEIECACQAHDDARGVLAAYRAAATAEESSGVRATDKQSLTVGDLKIDERKEAEIQYSITAFNYPDAPIGSRDWCLYWDGWRARAALAPTAQSKPCDMGDICIGCQPRAADGGCPHAPQTRSHPVRFAVRDGGRWIDDDDFTFDAMMKIDGDFGSDEARAQYAAMVCERLNAGESNPPAHGVGLPTPGSPEASAMIDSVLAEYQWPSNSKNAARAGYVAATRMLAQAPAAEPQGKPLQGCIDDLIGKHGSLRSVARECSLDVGYLSCLHRGEKNNPSDATLEALGLRKLPDRYCAAESHPQPAETDS